MVLPALAVGAGALSSIYAVGSAYDSYRYWSDYYRNTGYYPRYPFRSGLMDPLKIGAEYTTFLYGGMKNFDRVPSGRRIPRGLVKYRARW